MLNGLERYGNDKALKAQRNSYQSHDLPVKLGESLKYSDQQHILHASHIFLTVAGWLIEVASSQTESLTKQ